MKHIVLLSIMTFLHKWKGLIITIFVGAISGVLAEMLVSGKGLGLIVTIILGIAGGFLGAYLFKDMLNFTQFGLVNAIIRSTAGALILTILINLIIGKRNNKGYRGMKN